MTRPQPLAMLVYEHLLPGSQLVNRLRELGYRVTVAKPTDFAESAASKQPMVILLDLATATSAPLESLTALRANPVTAHIPIVAFAPLADAGLHSAALRNGANLTAVSDGILEQLPALLSQVLEVE